MTIYNTIGDQGIKWTCWSCAQNNSLCYAATLPTVLSLIVARAGCLRGRMRMQDWGGREYPSVYNNLLIRRFTIFWRPGVY